MDRYFWVGRGGLRPSKGADFIGDLLTTGEEFD